MSSIFPSACRQAPVRDALVKTSTARCSRPRTTCPHPVDNPASAIAVLLRFGRPPTLTRLSRMARVSAGRRGGCAVAHDLQRRRSTPAAGFAFASDHGDDRGDSLTAQDDHRDPLLDAVARPAGPVDVDPLVAAREAARRPCSKPCSNPRSASAVLRRVVLDRRPPPRAERSGAIEIATRRSKERISGLRPVALALPAARQKQRVAAALVDVAGPLLRAIRQAGRVSFGGGAGRRRGRGLVDELDRSRRTRRARRGGQRERRRRGSRARVAAPA